MRFACPVCLVLPALSARLLPVVLYVFFIQIFYKISLVLKDEISRKICEIYQIALAIC
jgi:hypothetical protein